MKVLLLPFWFFEYNVSLANSLAENAQVTLLLPKDKVGDYQGFINKKINLKLYDLPQMRHISNLSMLRNILGIIRDIQPDIIHLQGGHLWFSAILFALKKYAFVTTVHDVSTHDGDAPSKKILRFVQDNPIRCSQQIIVHGIKLKEQFLKNYKISPEKVNSIPHGEFSFFKRFSSSNHKTEKDLVLFFGRIWEYKGLHYLIKAEPLISKEIPNLKILIVGCGENFDKYENMMVHKEKFVIVNEYVNNEKIAEVFQRASIVVLPYIEASQSGVIPIAYAFAKPVVATNVGSIPEVVEDGRTGYLVPPRDEQKLATAIIDILKNEERRQSMGTNALAMTQNELSWGTIANKTIEVYKKTLRRT